MNQATSNPSGHCQQKRALQCCSLWAKNKTFKYSRSCAQWTLYIINNYIYRRLKDANNNNTQIMHNNNWSKHSFKCVYIYNTKHWITNMMCMQHMISITLTINILLETTHEPEDKTGPSKQLVFHRRFSRFTSAIMMTGHLSLTLLSPPVYIYIYTSWGDPLLLTGH